MAICCVCAHRTLLDSAIIFKAQNLQDSWFTDMAGVPENFLFGVSPNRLTDNSKALAWLERIFGPGSTSEKKAQATKASDADSSQKWCLLMFDGRILGYMTRQEKLANSATAALHERDEFQKRRKINANKQKRAKAVAQAKKPRHKIPAEGLQFANHAELRAHFSGHQLADLASTNEKIKRMQGKVGKVKEKNYRACL